MTQHLDKKKNKDEYVPFSVWAEDIIERVRLLQNEALDRYSEDKKFNTEILKLLNKIEEYVDRKRK
jgi:hypothetical protein